MVALANEQQSSFREEPPLLSRLAVERTILKLLQLSNKQVNNWLGVSSVQKSTGISNQRADVNLTLATRHTEQGGNPLSGSPAYTSLLTVVAM